MTQLTAHQEFFKHTNQLASELKNIESQVKSHEQQLLSGISDLTSAVLTMTMAGSASQGPVDKALKSYFDQMYAVLDAWKKKVNSYGAGLSLRKQFGDSLMVFVYGKVKAGKSSLGNYVACGRAKPDEQWMQQLAKALHSPEFFSGETNKNFGEAINHKQGFRVGEAETTSCIQGFTVPGLTWVDSPGLHSTNTENGALAQKYVESADLIIYPMNSAQPGRQSDLQELESLLKASKRILVLITRCDTIEQDEDDGGNLIEQRKMKSNKSRRDQEQHVQAELDTLRQKLGIEHADTSVLTVSVGYAEANGNSDDAMHASGMQSLFDTLRSILHSDGITLKKQVPQKNLQAFYGELLAETGELSLARLLHPLDKSMQQLDALQKQLENLHAQAQTRIKSQFFQSVDRLVEQHVGTRNIGALERELQASVDKAVAREYHEPLAQLYQNALETLQRATQDMGLCVGLKFRDETVKTAEDASRKNIAIGSGIGVAAGMVIGFFVGGRAGMVAGGRLGGSLGSTAGIAFNTQEKHTICVGDNREEIKNMLLEKGYEQIDIFLSGLNQQTLKQVITPMRDAITAVLNETRRFRGTIIKEQDHV